MKLNGKYLFNLFDLQRNFDPLQAYAKLGEFTEFARIHSMHLALMIRAKGAPYKKAEYLSKDLFMQILCCALGEQDWPDTADTPEACFNAFALPQDLQSEDSEPYTLEISEGRYAQKLAHITKDAALTHAPEDTRKALTLLAICELAEIDAEQCSFRSEEKLAAASSFAIEPFSAENHLRLTVSDQPYRFLYHTEDTLAEGSTIRTVQLQAIGGIGAKKKVVIELYSQAGAMVSSTQLSLGECRYVTAAGNRIIGFLPTQRKADTSAIRWNNAGCTQLHIETSVPWNLSFADHVSCFDTAGEQEGFLLIRKGRVLSDHYHQFEDMATRSRLDTLDDAVEVVLSKTGYRILTKHGRIISNERETNKTRIVSLYRKS